MSLSRLKVKAKVKVKPERTCIGCRQKRQKNSLIRISSKNITELSVNDSAVADGRGAYICYDRECIEKIFKKGAISRALKITAKDKDIRQLFDKINELIDKDCKK